MIETAAEELPCPDVIIIQQGPYLSSTQKYLLIKPITDVEILEAVKSMPLYKSLGIDGFLIEFFSTHWDIVKKDVVGVVQDFFKTGKMLKNMSCTNITLIPKISNPTTIKDYKPIAYCKTYYKIITQILTTRLKMVIDDIIAPS